jgi:hypothetical protein
VKKMYKEARRVISRRSMLPVLAAGLTGLVGVACSQPNYDVEPERVRVTPGVTVLPTATPVTQEVVEYQAQAFKAERVRFTNTSMVRNPFGNQVALDRQAVLLSERTRLSCGYSGTCGSMQELYVLTGRQVSPEMRTGATFSSDVVRPSQKDANVKISLANSRGSLNIGSFSVARNEIVRAGDVFHPDEIRMEDRNGLVYYFRLEMPDYSGGGNVARVLENDFGLYVEPRNYSTNNFPTKEFFRVKAID